MVKKRQDPEPKVAAVTDPADEFIDEELVSEMEANATTYFISQDPEKIRRTAVTEFRQRDKDVMFSLAEKLLLSTEESLLTKSKATEGSTALGEETTEIERSEDLGDEQELNGNASWMIAGEQSGDEDELIEENPPEVSQELFNDNSDDVKELFAIADQMLGSTEASISGKPTGQISTSASTMTTPKTAHKSTMANVTCELIQQATWRTTTTKPIEQKTSSRVKRASATFNPYQLIERSRAPTRNWSLEGKLLSKRNPLPAKRSEAKSELRQFLWGTNVKKSEKKASTKNNVIPSKTNFWNNWNVNTRAESTKRVEEENDRVKKDLINEDMEATICDLCEAQMTSKIQKEQTEINNITESSNQSPSTESTTPDETATKSLTNIRTMSISNNLDRYETTKTTSDLMSTIVTNSEKASSYDNISSSSETIITPQTVKILTLTDTVSPASTKQAESLNSTSGLSTENTSKQTHNFITSSDLEVSNFKSSAAPSVNQLDKLKTENLSSTTSTSLITEQNISSFYETTTELVSSTFSDVSANDTSTKLPSTTLDNSTNNNSLPNITKELSSILTPITIQSTIIENISLSAKYEDQHSTETELSSFKTNIIFGSTDALIRRSSYNEEEDYFEGADASFEMTGTHKISNTTEPDLLVTVEEVPEMDAANHQLLQEPGNTLDIDNRFPASATSSEIPPTNKQNNRTETTLLSSTESTTLSESYVSTKATTLTSETSTSTKQDNKTETTILSAAEYKGSTDLIETSSKTTISSVTMGTTSNLTTVTLNLTTITPNLETSTLTSTSTENPSTNTVESTTSTEKPSTNTVKSTTSTEKPSTNTVKSTTSTEKPSTNTVKSTTSTEKPTTNTVKSTTSTLEPITSTLVTTTSPLRLTTCVLKSTTKKHNLIMKTKHSTPNTRTMKTTTTRNSKTTKNGMKQKNKNKDEEYFEPDNGTDEPDENDYYDVNEDATVQTVHEETSTGATSEENLNMACELQNKTSSK
ncbi:uncharacterized protein LOC143195348 [Rhynchophorus ferrugineus]|uniref:uncharacterized protein LOC143195348 n=1 Tax=Rhynchophorus ferrugineus TaxID=354439 RepID=UPI003FCCF1BF